MPVRLNIAIDDADSLYPGEAMVESKGKPGRALGDEIRSMTRAG
jgi:hypothetical protein